MSTHPDEEIFPRAPILPEVVDDDDDNDEDELPNDNTDDPDIFYAGA